MQPPLGFTQLQLVGTGATSRVFSAFDTRTKTRVALKRLHRQLARDGEALSRLRRELDALGRLRHEGIVAVRDVIRWQGDPTVVMAFIEGEDLKARISEQGPLPSAQIDRIARALLDILVATHAAGIVHRDIKPQNIRLARDGTVYLLDFGSARLDAASQLTATGTTVGTPDYMAPELFAGSVHDPRADIYGLGATLYEAATGQAPQVAQTLTELAFRRTREPVAPVSSLAPDLDPAIAHVLDRCLERAPEDRYASATLARWALDHIEISKAFDLDRKTRPPCLHCESPIEPDAVVCPRCQSEHPFAYTPGSASVVVTNVKSPRKFMDAMADRFPERSTWMHQIALAERCAALQYDAQTLVSFIERDEAEALSDHLAEHGVESEVVDDEGTTGWKIYGSFLLLAVVAFVVLGVGFGVPFSWYHPLLLIAPAIASLLIDRSGAVVRGHQAMLSDGTLGAPLVPGLTGPLMTGAAALGASALVPALSAYAGLLAGGSLTLGAAGLVSLFSRTVTTPPTDVGSPEPSFMMKARQAFSVPASARARIKVGLGILLTGAVVSAVPLELYTLEAIREAVAAAPVSTVVAPTPVAPVVPDPGPVLPAPISDAPIADPAVTPVPAAPAVPKAPTAAPAPTPARPWQPYAGMGLFAGLLAAFVLRRRHRIRKEAEGILEPLAKEVLDGKDRLRAPTTRKSLGAGQLADRIAREQKKDPFVDAARQRAARLAVHLPKEDGERLHWSLQAMRPSLHDPVEQSLIARSVVEADPDHKLRLEFLALEGQMESLAAMRWAETLAESGEDES